MKIKNLRQLQAEKSRIARRRMELEKAMIYDWKDLKQALHPRNWASGLFSCSRASGSSTSTGGKPTGVAEPGSDGLAEQVSRLAGNLTRKAVQAAEQKAFRWFRRKS
ncbi:MAG TPA: hypothetical protein VG870_06770 [Chitinophagaceae bacterium]|nr:hypothetical protein [Chitinophagaceae bacterium]